MDRQNRLIEVYDYLRSRGLVHTKTDFASFLGFGRSSMAAALGGKEPYLTDTFFHRICETCPELSLDYLLTGEGSLLQPEPADGADSDRVRDLLERIADLDELVATQRLLIETLRDRLRSLGVEYVAPSLPTSRAARPYTRPSVTTFSLPAAEQEEQTEAPAPASGASSKPGNASTSEQSVSPKDSKS